MCRNSDELYFYCCFFYLRLRGRTAIRAMRWPLIAMIVCFVMSFFLMHLNYRNDRSLIRQVSDPASSAKSKVLGTFASLGYRTSDPWPSH
jgi:hypothetical protein